MEEECSYASKQAMSNDECHTMAAVKELCKAEKTEDQMHSFQLQNAPKTPGSIIR